jgi:hypothetical protein
MFCRLKDWRQVASSFDRVIMSFIATIDIAAIATGEPIEPERRIAGS